MNVVIKRKRHGIKKIGAMLFFSLFLLGGCTTQQSGVKPVVKAMVTPGVTVSGKEALWKKRQQQFLKMASWNMKGKVAMRYKVDNWSFGVDWSQKNKNTSVINIKNPFTGATVALLTQKNNKVTMKASDGKTYQDTNAERLLKKQAGIELPLEGLIYWARGITAPQYPKGTIVLDTMGRPKQITQANWVIKYRSYKGSAYNSLPKKVILTRKKDAVYVNLVAKKWKIR
ncbi:MAG: outer membrane lipoprotein LolB [Cocleimonas sp.]|nr:outer membrane lipoprotein LolB [Cocleimonas sp.]